MFQGAGGTFQDLAKSILAASAIYFLNRTQASAGSCSANIKLSRALDRLAKFADTLKDQEERALIYGPIWGMAIQEIFLRPTH